jgi:hypothetical protein
MKRKNPAAVALGRLGGIARATKLSSKRRSEIAKRAVEARERKRKGKGAARAEKIESRR